MKYRLESWRKICTWETNRQIGRLAAEGAVIGCGDTPDSRDSALAAKTRAVNCCVPVTVKANHCKQPKPEPKPRAKTGYLQTPTRRSLVSVQEVYSTPAPTTSIAKRGRVHQLQDTQCTGKVKGASSFLWS
uniref:Uncharacterized protein n=1 Tax=Trichuris muris TaxID=70415 RepID=A0A5S6QV57_TRIMR